MIAWQTGTARLLPRMLAGRKSVDLATGRARLSYRRAAELFEAQHRVFRRRPVHAAPAAAFPAHVRRGGGCLDAGVDEVVRSQLGARPREVRQAPDEGLRRYQADSDPAARRRPGR
ncbi:hypothetical protein [Nocardia uniformis]|uniref:hypothetical protein n=1 Tax=Nocardia uniformis TaxID=53432 RepID=UPI0008311D7F|nr:hypothetical protein [Nocardia uniformis]